MGAFKPLINLTKLMRYYEAGVGSSNVNPFTGIDNGSYYLDSTYTSNLKILNCSATSMSSPSLDIFFPYCSSVEVPYNSVTIPSQVGTVSNCSVVKTTKGWTMTFKVTGNGETIKSIVFVKGYRDSGNSTRNIAVFAYVLDDDGVKLDQERNFAISVEFNGPT